MQRLVRRARTAGRLWRFVPLALALFAVERLTRRAPAPLAPKRAAADCPGLSVIVPERGTPEFLAQTLEALAAALDQIDEPVQVIVVVNGAAAADYAELQTRHRRFEWQFHPRALGYNGAVLAGLAQARHDWTYLLNSDMRLERDALHEILAQRRPWVFAITSQIFFSDPARRREETGWSDFHPNPLVPEVYDREVSAEARLVRGNLYPGGGSSLCRTAVLRRYVRDSVDFTPFYWEDADWGIRAWSEGWEVLFCPASRAWHHHRGTVRRYYDEQEVARVIRRNAQLFDLRHDWTGRTPLTQLRDISLLDAASRRELGGIGLALRAARVRLATRRARQRGVRFDLVAVDRWIGESRFMSPTQPRKPRVLLASPFALFPPAHGGARRVTELLQRLAADVDFILLSDERSLYGDAAESWFSPLLATHLVEGRGDRAGEAPQAIDVRMQRCAWRGMRERLEHLVDRYSPDIVQVEFMELAGLAQERRAPQYWVLALHDVYLSGKPEDAASDAAQRTAMARFDALTVCSAEDAALLPSSPSATQIGNGAVDRRAQYARSPDTPRLLFMGPFRYAPNLQGLLEFLDTAWPVLRAQHPDLQLTVLGGEESAAIAANEPRLRQPGIELVSRFVDPTPYLAACTLSINPQREIRGSSIKLIESLLAGRVCVSTTDGARGFADAGLQGLATADSIAAMAAPILALLGDSTMRHARERADDATLDRFTWDAMAARQLALYQQLLATPR